MIYITNLILIMNVSGLSLDIYSRYVKILGQYRILAYSKTSRHISFLKCNQKFNLQAPELYNSLHELWELFLTRCVNLLIE